MTERRDYTLDEMEQGEAPDDTHDIIVHPGTGPLLRLGVELVIEAYERDRDGTLARLADIATRSEEPVQIPPELLITAESPTGTG